MFSCACFILFSGVLVYKLLAISIEVGNSFDEFTWLNTLLFLSEVINKGLYEVPMYSNKVAAGFPSPADDYLEDKIDLNQYLVKHPASTFLVRASGESMINAGIFPDDILVVDRSLKAEDGKVVIAVVDNELTVKRYRKKGKKIFLEPENNAFDPIVIADESEAFVWGVVTNVIHNL